MKICLKEGCNNVIPSYVIYEGKKHYLSNGGRLYCLECSPYKVRQFGDRVCQSPNCNNIIEKSTIYKGKKVQLKSSRKYCLECSPYLTQYPTEEERKQRLERRLHKARKQSVISVRKRRKRLMQMAVEYKGGKCMRCGYDRCIRALEFHHRDPSEKEFGLSVRGLTRSWEKVKKEIEKCDLLCANCHREVEEQLHSGLI